jgi:hypothetical protein
VEFHDHFVPPVAQGDRRSPIGRRCGYHEPELPPPPPTLPPENPPPPLEPELELDGGVCVLDHDWPVL